MCSLQPAASGMIIADCVGCRHKRIEAGGKNRSAGKKLGRLLMEREDSALSALLLMNIAIQQFQAPLQINPSYRKND